MVCDPRIVVIAQSSPRVVEIVDRGVVVTPSDSPTVVVQPGASELVVVTEAAPEVVVERPVVRTVEAILEGPQGPPGIDGDKTYVHVQSVPLAEWTVLHNLNKYPAVTAADSGGGAVIGDVQYDSVNQCTLRFVSEFSGKAYCN